MGGLPLYLIEKKCLPGGRRLDKKPKADYSIGYNQVNRGLPAHYHNIKPANTLPSNEGDIFAEEIEFKYWEFRFWAVEFHDGLGPVAVCRACGDVKTTLEGRQAHKSKIDCCRALVDAYKLLLREPKRCVMCDEQTTWEKFGVPLCLYKGNCLQKWYHTPDPSPLLEALRLEAWLGEKSGV